MAKPILESKAMGTVKASKLRQSDLGDDEAQDMPEQCLEEEVEDAETRENERFRTTVLINLASVMEVCVVSVV